MHIIQYDEFGGPEVLHAVDAPIPQVGPDEVLVRVEAAGVNFADIMQRRNTYLTTPSLPAFPGSEIAGTVTAVGANVMHVMVGTSVTAFLTNGGGYAEYAAIPSAAVIVLPPGFPVTQAPALHVQGLTAYLLLKHAGRLATGETVVVHAAAGGVGSLAIQLARQLGAAHIVATASSTAKLEQAWALGADMIVNYTERDWPQQIMTVTDGRGADVILDAVGGDILTQSLACLAPFGRLLTYGDTSGQPTTINTGGMLTPNQSVIGFYLGGYFRYPQFIQEAYGVMIEGIATGALKVQIADVFSLAQAAEAHRRIEARQTTGKVILQP